MSTETEGGWTQFWDTDHSVYVSPRHLEKHYSLIADDIIRALPPGRPRVLDHGCGEALHAARVAGYCESLLLCDAAQRLRSRLSARFAGEPNIAVLSPAEVESLEEASLDLVVANSLVQYLSRAELEALLGLWRRLLKPTGRIIIADVISPGQTALVDAGSLLRFAAANGFLLDAVKGLARTFFSDYRKLRARLGLARYSEAEILGILRAAGFEAQRLQPNFGYNDARIAVAGVKPA